jgi:hypothetical protein
MILYAKIRWYTEGDDYTGFYNVPSVVSVSTVPSEEFCIPFEEGQDILLPEAIAVSFDYPEEELPTYQCEWPTEEELREAEKEHQQRMLRKAQDLLEVLKSLDFD